MSTTFAIAIDHNDNGIYATEEALTQAVISLTWRLGMAAPYDPIAQVATAQVTVRNMNQAFSPEQTPLLPGKRLRITSDDGTATRTHFIGRITHVEPTPGDWGHKLAIIHASDAMHELAQNQVRVTPLVDVRADEAIAAIIDQCEIRFPVLAGYIVLGRADSRVGQKLFGDPLDVDLQQGRSHFAYIGDLWGAGIAADEAIGQLANSERGRFYVNRQGQAVFLNRHHTLLQTTSQASFDDDMQGLAYIYGDEVLSEVDVTVVPRTIGNPGSLLWSLAQPQRLPRQDARQIVARYRDAEDNPMGALSLDNVAFTAKATATGGPDLTAQVDVGVLEAGMSAAVLEVRNFGEEEAYLHTLDLFGTPLMIADPLTLEWGNRYNLTTYGKQALELYLPALSDISEADQIARYELVRRQQPRGSVHQIGLNARSHAEHALARSLFDRISLSDTQTGHSGDYFIVAEEHHVEVGGYRHRVRWTLEPAEDDRFFIIGQHNLDGTRYPMY
ncbi:MAG: hypothetical protein CL607_00215 [Anaerolineaceae bacterium]|nr:hypothetical protein [Anaerolineaceae bacterium]